MTASGSAMFEKVVVGFVRRLPYGGYRLLRLLSGFLPGLRRYPLKLPLAENIVIHADLSLNVFFPLIKYGCYPHQITEDLIIQSILREEDCVVDVGANIGYVSLLCALIVGNRGVVHSFEPSAVCFPFLQALSDHVRQITPWRFAVSDCVGSSYFRDESMVDRSLLVSCPGVNTYPVPCYSIDAWVTEHRINRIDFLKIDAEGHDLKVISGASSSIDSFRPIIEFEAFDKDCVRQIVEILSKSAPCAGYRVFRCANHHPATVLSKPGWTNNWFAIPESRRFRFPDFVFHRSFLIEEQQLGSSIA